MRPVHWTGQRTPGFIHQGALARRRRGILLTPGPDSEHQEARGTNGRNEPETREAEALPSNRGSRTHRATEEGSGLLEQIAPVLVLSTGRCGSTRVSDVPMLHPEILSLSEVISNLGPRALFRNRISGRGMRALCSRRNPALRAALSSGGIRSENLYPFGTPQARFSPLTVPPILCTTLPHLTPRFESFCHGLEPVVQTRPGESLKNQSLFLFEWLRTRFGRWLWIERSGASPAPLPSLRRSFPEARVIHVCRDGRDTALSMSRHPAFKAMLATFSRLERMGLRALEAGPVSSALALFFLGFADPGKNEGAGIRPVCLRRFVEPGGPARAAASGTLASRPASFACLRRRGEPHARKFAGIDRVYLPNPDGRRLAARGRLDSSPDYVRIGVTRLGGETAAHARLCAPVGGVGVRSLGTRFRVPWRPGCTRMLGSPEELLLLLVDENRDGLIRTLGWTLACTLASAMRMDPALEGRIHTHPERLVLLDARPLDDALLVAVLADIARKDETRDARFWLDRIAEKGEEIRDGALAALVAHAAIEVQDDGFLSLQPCLTPARYYLTLDQESRHVRLRVMGALFSHDIPDPRDIVIISLADASGAFDRLPSAAEMEPLGERIALVSRMDLIGHSVVDANRTGKAPARRATSAGEIPLAGRPPPFSVLLGRAFKLGRVFRIAKNGLVRLLEVRFITRPPAKRGKRGASTLIVVAGPQASRFGPKNNGPFRRRVSRHRHSTSRRQQLPPAPAAAAPVAISTRSATAHGSAPASRRHRTGVPGGVGILPASMRTITRAAGVTSGPLRYDIEGKRQLLLPSIQARRAGVVLAGGRRLRTRAGRAARSVHPVGAVFQRCRPEPIEPCRCPSRGPCGWPRNQRSPARQALRTLRRAHDPLRVSTMAENLRRRPHTLAMRAASSEGLSPHWSRPRFTGVSPLVRRAHNLYEHRLYECRFIRLYSTIAQLDFRPWVAGGPPKMPSCSGYSRSFILRVQPYAVGLRTLTDGRFGCGKFCCGKRRNPDKPPESHRRRAEVPRHGGVPKCFGARDYKGRRCDARTA